MRSSRSPRTACGGSDNNSVRLFEHVAGGRHLEFFLGLGTLLVGATACAPRWVAPRPRELQAWVVYFDIQDGLSELQQHGRLFDRVSLFAYELDPQGNPRPAPKLDETIGPFLRLAEERGFKPWVTVVNDVRYSPDSTVAKDGHLVHNLIIDSTRRAAHARDLASKVSVDGFEGLHLDYERVPQSDTTAFQEFIDALRAELGSRGLGLEIVMEPTGGPLPDPGSTRVTVMAYDLFGEHSGPGPRSTPTFISELGHRASVDGDSAAALALAVSGFAWEPDGGVRSLDWSVARQLADEASDARRRNSDHVPSVTLDDGTVIWYEDAESLFTKWQAAWKAGFRRLAIWRLGGNDESLFDLLRGIKPDQP